MYTILPICLLTSLLIIGTSAVGESNGVTEKTTKVTVGPSKLPTSADANATAADVPSSQDNADNANSANDNATGSSNSDHTTENTGTNTSENGNNDKAKLPEITTSQTPKTEANVTGNVKVTTNSPSSDGEDDAHRTSLDAVTVTESNSVVSGSPSNNTNTSSPPIPSTSELPDLTWMKFFLHSHHYHGEYSYDDVRCSFELSVRYVHPNDARTLVSTFYDKDGAIIGLNATSSNGVVIVFKMARVYSPGLRFPIHTEQFEITGSIVNDAHGTYFTGNVTRPDQHFTWIYMNKGLGKIELGDSSTKIRYIISITIFVALLGITGTIAILCWASKNGYFRRRRHKTYKLFKNSQVSYETEAETIHIYRSYRYVF